MPFLLEEKRLLIGRSGVIEFIADGTSIGKSAAGGAQKWLTERHKLFQMRDSLSSEIAQRAADDGHPGLRQSLFRESHRLTV